MSHCYPTPYFAKTCNIFSGKTGAIRKGDIQALVEATTVSGMTVQAVITHGSLQQLNLAIGSLVRAEVNSQWVIIARDDREPWCTTENRFCGRIERIRTGTINSEISLRLEDGNELCAIVGSSGSDPFGLQEGDRDWAISNCYCSHPPCRLTILPSVQILRCKNVWSSDLV